MLPRRRFGAFNSFTLGSGIACLKFLVGAYYFFENEFFMLIDNLLAILAEHAKERATKLFWRKSRAISTRVRQ